MVIKMAKNKTIPIITAISIAVGILAPLLIYDNLRFETVHYKIGRASCRERV